MASASPSRIQVIDRATGLLDAIARYREPVSLKILMAETGLHASTAHRILGSLMQNGLVEKDSDNHYRLGLRLVQLGSRLHSKLDLRAIALPVMERLRDSFDESVNLSIREGDQVVYIERATPNRMIHVHQVVGSRAPLHVTAVGKLMLGAAGEKACCSYAERTNLPAYTINTLTSLDRLLKETARAIENGYALDNEEAETGVGCIGTLLYDGTGQVAAGLSVSAPIERRDIKWVEALVQAAGTVSQALGAKTTNPK
tara:strand:+ start:2258 stop:3028 length:771 start_codon:yes stop_codon:yes gene_type:complete